MNNLLSANFMRLKKEKVFWILLFFMCAFGMGFPTVIKIDEMKTGFLNTIDNAFGHYAILIGVIMAVFCSFFVGREYSDGTIRNKIISGKKRTDVYLANFITCAVVSVIICFVFFLAYLGVGVPLLGFFSIGGKTVLQFFMTVLFLSIAYSAIDTLIAMSSTNKTVTAVLCILLAFLFLLIGIQFNQMLSQPETVLGMTVKDGVSVYEEFPNPDYLNDEERKMIQFAYDFIPGGQVAQCMATEAVNLPLLPVYSFIIALVTTGIGQLIFRKKDLK